MSGMKASCMIGVIEVPYGIVSTSLNMILVLVYKERESILIFFIVRGRFSQSKAKVCPSLAGINLI
jgi:hypothetical protein